MILGKPHTMGDNLESFFRENRIIGVYDIEEGRLPDARLMGDQSQAVRHQPPKVR